MNIIELTKEQFNAYSFHNTMGSIYQTSLYGQLMSTQGYKEYYLGLTDESNNLCGASLFLSKKFFGSYYYAYLPRGFIIDYNNKELIKTFLELLKPFLKKHKISYIRMDPPVIWNPRTEKSEATFRLLKDLGFTHRGFNAYFENRIARTTMVTKIDNPQIDLFKRFHRETKNKIRKANRNGLIITKGNKEDLEEIYRLNNGKYLHKLTYYQTMYDILNPKNMMDVYRVKLDPQVYLQNNRSLYEKELKENNKLANLLYKKVRNHKIINKKMASDKRLNIYKKEITLATQLMQQFPGGLYIGGNIVCAYKNELTFLFEGFDQNFKHFCPNHLSIWAIMKTYTNIGVTKFNLNAISSNIYVDDQFYGLYIFKKGFDANIEEHMGEFEYVINKFSIFLYKIKLKFKKWL